MTETTEWQIMVRSASRPEEYRALDYVRARTRVEAVETWRSTNPKRSQTLDLLGMTVFALLDAGGI